MSQKLFETIKIMIWPLSGGLAMCVGRQNTN